MGTIPSQIPVCAANQCWGEWKEDPGGMLAGLMVLVLHLIQPKGCSLPCSELKGEHGPNTDKGCSEQGSHGSPELSLLLLTCRGLWLQG